MLNKETSAKNVASLVKKATASYGRAQFAVQAAAVAILEHAKAYGDCLQAKHLCRGVPARERNSLIGWFSLYSPIGVAMGKTASDDQCRFIRPDSKNYHDFDIAAAKAHPWFDDPAGVNQEPRPLNTIIEFYQVIDRMLKKAIKDAEAENRYDPEQREIVKEQASDLLVMVNKYRAKHLKEGLTAQESTVGKAAEQEHKQAKKAKSDAPEAVAA